MFHLASELRVFGLTLGFLGSSDKVFVMNREQHHCFELRCSSQSLLAKTDKVKNVDFLLTRTEWDALNIVYITFCFTNVLILNVDQTAQLCVKIITNNI